MIGALTRQTQASSGGRLGRLVDVTDSENYRRHRLVAWGLAVSAVALGVAYFRLTPTYRPSPADGTYLDLFGAATLFKAAVAVVAIECAAVAVWLGRRTPSANADH